MGPAMYSIVSKTVKGRQYYYLRQQRRIGGKVRQKDYYLGRMDSGGVPDAAAKVNCWLTGMDRRAGGAGGLWKIMSFGFHDRTVEGAAAWWRKIVDVRRALATVDRNWRRSRSVTVRDGQGRALFIGLDAESIRFIDESKTKLSKLEKALVMPTS